MTFSQIQQLLAIEKFGTLSAAAELKLPDGAEIVEECIHEFEPIGVTYFAVITTSHFSVHTWPEYGYAAVDIFSCTDTVLEGISEMLQELFEAKEVKTQLVERDISAGTKDRSI